MKKFAVFDIDGTLIRWQLYHAMTEALAKGSPETRERIKSLRKPWKDRADGYSFKAYEKGLIKIFHELLVGLPAYDFTRAADKVFDEYKDQVYTYTRDLIRELKDDGYLLLAISGSQTEIVERVADYYGFDDFSGAQLEVKDGHFTGNTVSGARNKHTALQKLAEKHDADFKDSLGIGDSKNDAAFLELVEKPIAFNPDRELFFVARENGWKIVVERKNVVYELESKHDEYALAETDR